MAQTSSQTALQTPFLDANNRVTWTWTKLLQQWMSQLSKGFDDEGNLISNLGQDVGIVGRGGTIGTITQHISDVGVVQSAGMVAATDTAQGAVMLAAGSVSNTLGSAAMAPSSAFDPAGSAGAAQSGAQAYADGVAANAQSNAEAFASDATNITTGTLDAARLSGVSATIATAKLTPSGANGSMTFLNGLLVAQVQAT